MTRKNSIVRATCLGFVASGVFLILVALPTFFLDAIGEIRFLPKLWSLLWQIFLTPAALLNKNEFLNDALTLSSPDPRIALIPALVANFVLWGVMLSVIAVVTLRIRNET